MSEMEYENKLILEALSLLLSKGIPNDDRINLSIKINNFLVDEEFKEDK